MKDRIKTMGAAAVAVMAIAALTGGSATATGGGHFVTGTAHTLVKLASNKEAHSFTWWNSNGGVACGKNSHEGTTAATTVESFNLAPVWEEGCLTGDGKTPMGFKPNGCTFTFKVASGTTATTEQTMQLLCPAGKVYEVDQGVDLPAHNGPADGRKRRHIHNNGNKWQTRGHSRSPRHNRNTVPRWNLHLHGHKTVHDVDRLGSALRV